MTFICSKCGHEKPETERLNRRRVCKACAYAYVDEWRKKNAERDRDRRQSYRQEHREEILRWKVDFRKSRPAERMIASAKARAKKYQLPFAITVEDITPLPSVCPVLGIPLRVGDGRQGPNSFSLDRIVPELGYVPGNVAVISMLANSIKATSKDPEEIIRVGVWLREKLTQMRDTRVTLSSSVEGQVRGGIEPPKTGGT